MPAALPDWARAHGAPVASGRIRSTPEEFFVAEILGFEPAGDGEHDLLLIEKAGSNTDWLARQLARHAGVRPVDVGYAGLKDRNARTRQWFSVRRPNRDGSDWRAFSADDVTLLRCERHDRKLRRGAHRGNRFEIVVRGETLTASAGMLEERFAAICRDGVPNYFAEQRFGREAANLELARAVLGGRRVRRQQRSIALSTARAYLFNAILDARVRAGNWRSILPGERANLAGSGSVFAVREVTDDLVRRCESGDIHPTASLWGDGAPLADGTVADLETAVVNHFDDLAIAYADGLPKARVDAASRALRLVPAKAGLDVDGERVRLQFELPRGAYATAVLREIFTLLTLADSTAGAPQVSRNST